MSKNNTFSKRPSLSEEEAFIYQEGKQISNQNEKNSPVMESEEPQVMPWEKFSKKKEPERQLSIRYPESLANKLDYITHELHISRTKFVIEAIEKHIDEHLEKLGIISKPS